MCVDIEKELAALEKNKIIAESKILHDTVIKYQNRNSIKEYRIAVVGEYSSGKSTFINSIIGKDLLTHATKETTATITYIRNVHISDDRANTCIVKFVDGRTVKTGLDSISEYTTTVSKKHDVAAAIESVEIFIHFIDTNREIVIVDTPGLNGIADRHREMTIAQIKQAHACIYLLQLRGVSSSDVEFLKLLSKYQYSYIFVQNFIDELKTGEESVKEKIKQVRNIIEEKVFGNRVGDYRCEYCGISALLALASKDKKIKRVYGTDTEDITLDDREKYIVQSKYDDFYKILQRVVNDKAIERKIYIDQCRNIFYLLCEAIEQGTDIQSEYEELLKYDEDYTIIQQAKNNINRLSEQRGKIWNKLETMIRSKFADIRKQIISDIENELQNISNCATEFINGYNSYEKFNSECCKKIENKITNDITQYMHDLKNKKIKLYQSIYQDVISRMEEYTHITNKDNSPKFSISNGIDSRKFINNDFQIKIKAKQDKLDIIKKDIISLESSESSYLNQINHQKSKKSELELKEKSEISSIKMDIGALGKRPEKERVITGYEERKVERGGIIGWVKDLFTTKRERIPIYGWDDTAGKAYDQERRNLEQKLRSKKSYYDSEISKINSRLSDIQAKKDQVNVERSKTNRHIDKLKREIEELQEDAKLYEEKAKREYLVYRKNKLISDVKAYLMSGEYSVLNLSKDNLSGKSGMNGKGEIEENCCIVIDVVKKEFDYRIKMKTERYSEAIESNSQKLKDKYKDYGEDLEYLKNLHDKMQEVISNESV